MTQIPERIDRLERLMADLCQALLNRGTLRDGAWGHPSFHDEVKRIEGELSFVKEVAP